MKLVKKLALTVGGCLVLPILLFLGLMLMIIAPVAVLFDQSSNVNVQVGSVNISQLATQSASNTVYQVYPDVKIPSGSSSSDVYQSDSPIPPEADLEPGTPTSLVAITTSSWSQTELVERCYATWSIVTPYGGEYCGSGQLDADPGQCTFWALLNWDNPDVGKITGNADQYFASAKTAGIPTSQTPVVGAIVVWGPGGQYGSVGHVAIVAALDPTNNAFVVSEMNYDYTPWKIDYRVVSMNSNGAGHGDLLGFILPSAAGASGT